MRNQAIGVVSACVALPAMFGMLSSMFLGEDLLAYLVLAFGAALCVGNFMAVVRPPERQLDEGRLERAPVGRSLLYSGIGLLAAVWALASLVSG